LRPRHNSLLGDFAYRITLSTLQIVDTAQQPPTASALQAEAQWLHRALFGCPPRVVLLERYAEAMRHVLLQVDPQESSTVQKVVDLKLDVEAVELALRRPVPHLLTRKLQALAILAEATDGYHAYFTNDRDSRFAAFASLAAAAIRTPLAKLQGKYLVWRHELV
jgi:hypothetical protein